MSFPTVVQSTPSIPSWNSTINNYELDDPCQAGNLIVLFLAGDKNTGTLSITDNTGSGTWTFDVSVLGSSVSTYVARKVAVGGETSIVATTDNNSATGNTGYVEEIADAGTGAWMLTASVIPAYSNADRTTVASGNTDAADYDSRAYAVATIDSQQTYTGSFSNGYVTSNTPVGSPSAGGGNAGCWVGTGTLSQGATTSTTFTSSGADQIYLAIVAYGRVESGVEPIPEVDAGADATFVLGETFERTPEETGGAPTSRAWTIQSGPTGPGSLSDLKTLLWSPVTAGTYVLRYTATNASGSDFDEITVEVVELTPGGERVNLSVSPTAVPTVEPWYGPNGAFAVANDLTGMSRTDGVHHPGGGSLITGRWDVIGGARYVTAVEVKPTAAENGSIGIDFTNGDGFIDGDSVSISVQAGIAQTVWLTSPAPVAATKAVMKVSGFLSPFDATAHIAEQGATFQAYFDGDTPGASWDGDPGISTSRYTPPEGPEPGRYFLVL